MCVKCLADPLFLIPDSPSFTANRLRSHRRITLAGAYRSRYHFQQALATRTDIPDLGGSTAPDVSMDDGQARAQLLSQPHLVDTPRPGEAKEAETQSQTALDRAEPPENTGTAKTKAKRKHHPCPYTGCNKEYKQLSGLRYHLTHVRNQRAAFRVVICQFVLSFMSSFLTAFFSDV